MPGGSDDRDQPTFAEQPHHVGHIAVAADEPVGLLDQRDRSDGAAQGWEVAGEAGRHQLVDLGGLHDVAETVSAQGIGRRVPAQVVRQRLGGGRRQQDLASVTDRVQA